MIGYMELSAIVAEVLVRMGDVEKRQLGRQKFQLISTGVWDTSTPAYWRFGLFNGGWFSSTMIEYFFPYIARQI